MDVKKLKTFVDQITSLCDGNVTSNMVIVVKNALWQLIVVCHLSCTLWEWVVVVCLVAMKYAEINML